MPQFDKVTFLNQLFWLGLFFTGLFFFCNNFFLPKIGCLLKGRYKKLQKKSGFALSLTNELKSTTDKVNFTYDNLLFNLKNFLDFSIEYTNHFVESHNIFLIEEHFSKSFNALENSIHKKNIRFLLEKKTSSN